MNLSATEPPRCVLKYPGAKWRIADWIIDHFPPHHSYLEPYFGSGAIFFSKNPAAIETVNDLDGEVVNLFRVLRRQPTALAAALAFTPYARQEYDDAFCAGRAEVEPLERARLFLVRCWQSHGYRQNHYKVGWKRDVQGREAAYAAKHWHTLPEWVIRAAERLKDAQIEHRPAVELIREYNHDNVLIYADPPYLLGTRSGKTYRHEMTDGQHAELLETLLAHKGPVVLSGYDNELYNSYLGGWSKDSVDTYASHAQPRTETLWCNFRLQVTLFDLEMEKG